MMNGSDGWGWGMSWGMGGFGWGGVLAVCVIIVGAAFLALRRRSS